MYSRLHKPQREPIKAFCLDRDREGYGEVIGIQVSTEIGASAYEVSVPIGGPLEVVQLEVIHLQGGSNLHIYWALYASQTVDTVAGAKGDVKIAERHSFDGANIIGLDQSFSYDSLSLAINKKIYFSPVVFSLNVNNLSGGAERTHVIISVRGIKVL